MGLLNACLYFQILDHWIRDYRLLPESNTIDTPTATTLTFHTQKTQNNLIFFEGGKKIQVVKGNNENVAYRASIKCVTNSRPSPLKQVNVFTSKEVFNSSQNDSSHKGHP